MSNAQNDEADALRQQLADADKKRRDLLLMLYLKHGGDTQPILEMLFAGASRLTLEKIEVLLGFDLNPEEASGC